MAAPKEEFMYEITKAIGVIGEGSRGWRKEVNIVSWNGRPPKLDIRDWNETHEKMGKGVTLSGSEVRMMLELLGNMDLSTLEE
ncbi:MAG: PC4/YdbC family ssDNA-binding protein [Lachnospiraceae bacterium]|nr:PC4/YdbC family ssDNA-binding protein [Lachnospiraceae bacterium]